MAVAKLFELWLLVFDDIDQKLIFKTTWCDSKVDQGNLDANFWQVVRVGKLCGDEQLELVRVGDVRVSESHDPLATLLHDILGEHRLERWVKGLINIL